jgi:two-component system chemotaxis sensor kinase CheA
VIKIDLTQFHQTFFEETAEHLAEMERLLVTLDLDAPDSESLNGIFRAAHSIKGGAGIFGFTDMIGVTHAAESLLDKIRSGKLPLLPVMVDAFLETGDLLSRLLDQHRGGLPTDAADAAESQRLTAVLETLTANALAGAAVSANKADATEAAITQESAPELDDSFGLFEAMTDESFGLFEEPVAAKDESFGLFEEVTQPATAPIDAVQSVVEPSVAEKAAALASAPIEKPAQIKSTSAAAPAASRAPAGTESSSIRVSVEKADQLINLVGELVITQAMLAQLTGEFDPVRHEKLHEALVQFERNTRELQEAAMSMRMLPVGSVFSRFPRVVRDTTAKLGKQVDLILEGESTELDKGLIEKLADPLTHLVRNAIDHGIEMPDERIAAGKSPKGRVVLSAYHHGGNVVIQIVDDGHGLSRDRILAKARERGFNVSDDMADADVWQLIFEPGFSTAAVVTDISGRGVGMDVVRRNIQAMNGRIEIESFAGVGSRFTVWLPLTLAILEGMLLSVDSDTYVVPLTNIIESLLPEPGTINTVATQGRVIRVRGDYLPIASLRDLLSLPAAPAEVGVGIVLLLESEGKKFALQVDELLGQSQVVIKSLENNYKRVTGFAGATILGNGRVAMILDVDALRRMTLSPTQSRSPVLQPLASVNSQRSLS